MKSLPPEVIFMICEQFHPDPYNERCPDRKALLRCSLWNSVFNAAANRILWRISESNGDTIPRQADAPRAKSGKIWPAPQYKKPCLYALRANLSHPQCGMSSEEVDKYVRKRAHEVRQLQLGYEQNGFDDFAEDSRHHPLEETHDVRPINLSDFKIQSLSLYFGEPDHKHWPACLSEMRKGKRTERGEVEAGKEEGEEKGSQGEAKVIFPSTLRSLNIQGYEGLPDIVLMGIKELRFLSSLRLDLIGMSEETAKKIPGLIENFPNLSEISLSGGGERIPEKTRCEIMLANARHKKLRSIFCFEMPEEGLKLLSAEEVVFPSLTRMSIILDNVLCSPSDMARQFPRFVMNVTDMAIYNVTYDTRDSGWSAFLSSLLEHCNHLKRMTLGIEELENCHSLDAVLQALYRCSEKKLEHLVIVSRPEDKEHWQKHGRDLRQLLMNVKPEHLARRVDFVWRTSEHEWTHERYSDLEKITVTIDETLIGRFVQTS